MIWALSNHIDKFFLTKFFKNSTGYPLIIITSLTSLLFLPFILIFTKANIGVGWPTILILTGLGIVSILGGLIYLYVLNKDDPSVVIPLFQLMPVFNYLFGLIFLHEHLSSLQIVGSVLIIGGAVALTAEQEGKKFRIKKDIFWLMVLCCIIHSFFSLIFKLYVKVDDFWAGNFWVYCGTALYGILILIFSKSWRDQFLSMFKVNGVPMAGLTLFSEGIAIGANFIFNYALLLMPIALIAVISNGLQPFFVLLFGIILTMVFPHLAHETLGKKHLLPKITSIFVILAGTILLNR